MRRIAFFGMIALILTTAGCSTLATIAYCVAVDNSRQKCG